jgi:hypothetical protein
VPANFSAQRFAMILLGEETERPELPRHSHRMSPVASELAKRHTCLSALVVISTESQSQLARVVGRARRAATAAESASGCAGIASQGAEGPMVTLCADLLALENQPDRLVPRPDNAGQQGAICGKGVAFFSSRSRFLGRRHL